MTKPMSGAAYRAHAQAVKAQEPTEIVTLKSGSVFELRRPDLQGYMVTGRLPQSLLTEAMAAWKKSGIAPAEEVAGQLGDKEVVDSLIFMREVVSECCINPKFVEFAMADDEIGTADMLPADFNEIFAWAMGHEGVTGLDALKTFRNRSERRAAASRAHKPKQRDTSKQPVGA